MNSTRPACLLGAAVLSLHGAPAAAHPAAFSSSNVWVADASQGMKARAIMARYASWMEFFHATDLYFAQHLEQRATAQAQ